MVALTRIQEKEQDWPRIAGHPVHPEVEAMVLFLAEQLREKKTRVLQLEAEISRLKGALATHTKHRFGPRSERSSSETYQQTQDKKRKKGAQPGHKGSGRKIPESLPVETIVYEVPEPYCPICGKPYYKTPLFETSTDIHVEIRYVRRVHKRTIYKSTCTCHIPRLITAPAPPKLIPKGKFSTSFWAKVLYDRFVLQIPWYRQLQAMKDYELDVSRGVITGGLKNIFPYLVPFYEFLEQTIKTEKYRHSDETSWMMIEERRQRWWLWAQSSSKIIFFCLDPSRSHRVPARLMENNGDKPFVIVADRFAAYKKLDNVLIAFCWAHVRRDFIKVQASLRNNHQVVTWTEQWLDMIRTLYKINESRLYARESKTFDHYHKRLVSQLDYMWQASVEEVETEAQHKVLKSLHRHWYGLTLFADDPYIPMDNNKVERELRGPVLGRKNSPVIRSSWAGLLIAIMYSVTETCKLHKVNPYLWLEKYLEACACHQDAPPNLEDFLPWNVKEYGFTEKESHQVPCSKARSP